MEKYNLNFCFKGNRDYVHGTDIFNNLIKKLKTEIINSKLDLSFHGIAKTNIHLSYKKPDNEEQLKFVLKYTNTENDKIILYGVENGVPIKCRYEYEEEKINKASNINLENKEVILKHDTSFDFIENVVAMNKSLLEKIFGKLDGKWFFTRLQLNELSGYNYPLRLELKANFNFKLTKTEIFLNDKSIGFIYFSLVGV